MPNTLLASRTPGDIVAEVLMSRTAFKGLHLLLEGPGDSKFWKAHTRPGTMEPVKCGGKSLVLRGMAELEALNVPLVLCIVDDDLDSLFGASAAAQNVLVTDTNDLEGMLLSSPALERVTDELCDEDALAAFEKAQGPIRQGVVDRSMLFAQLRYINRRHGLNVDFNDFSPWKYLDHKTWVLDSGKLVDDFAKASGQLVLWVEAELRAAPTGPTWSIVHGKDAMKVLRCGMGGLGAKQADTVLQSLRLAFGQVMLAATNMHAAFLAWEARNGVQVLV